MASVIRAGGVGCGSFTATSLRGAAVSLALAIRRAMASCNSKAPTNNSGVVSIMAIEACAPGAAVVIRCGLRRSRAGAGGRSDSSVAGPWHWELPAACRATSGSQCAGLGDMSWVGLATQAIRR